MSVMLMLVMVSFRDDRTLIERAQYLAPGTQEIVKEESFSGFSQTASFYLFHRLS